MSGSTVTLTGATWPSWASGAHIRIADTIGRILSTSSSTVATLDLGFTGNISAGTAYTLYRVTYPLPADFRNLDEPSDEFNWWSGLYVTPDIAMKLERVANSSGHPYHWTVIKDPASDGWAIKLLGYPTKAETIDFMYRRTARALRYSGHEASCRAGTIARSTTAVTGTSTQFSTGMIGSVLRVGDTTNIPGPITSITPWVSESKITDVASATALTTEGSGTVAGSTKYLITDPIDVPPHMHNVIYSAAEYWLARIRHQKPDNAFAMYQRDLRLAMEMDQLAPLSGRSREVWHDGGWRSPLKPDGGA
ncbi:MAG: hypothetical protein EBR40_12040 [Proteobacteria bacterium]|nr:hypothetical protein [Pseudomonadota bacterium]